jgi:outer membrane lipoprotein-sorting protein
MENENKSINMDHSEDILDRAVTRLRQSPIPPGPGPETLEQVLQALTQRPNLRVFQWFKKYAVAALIAAGLVSWIILNSFQSRSAGLAFADICRQVLAAQTVTYKNTTTWNQNGKTDPYSFATRVMVLAPSRERTVYSTGQITIFNYQLGKGLELSPSEKKAALVNISNLPKELTNKNLLEIFREFPESPARDLGLRPLHGRPVRVFQIAREQMVYTVWIDPKSALPLQIEYSFNQNDPLWGEPVEIKIVKSEIVFNAPLDPALFTLTPPKNFTVQTASRPCRPDQPAENDLIQALRTYTQNHQGNFPPAFNLKTLLDLPPQTDWETKKFALRAVTFVQILRAENLPWLYSGQYKKLNQPNTPIFQYQLKNSQLCHTLHADLTITESLQ